MGTATLAPYRVANMNKTGMVEFEGDLTPPVTSYAGSYKSTAIGSRGYSQGFSSAWTKAAVVQRRLRQNGLIYSYSHGGVTNSTRLPYPGSSDGFVRSSVFQRVFVTLHTWTTNVGWFSGGYPRNLGWSFRTPQLQFNAQTNGGSGGARMTQRPMFNKVQTVPRYSTVPPAFPTTSAKA